MAVEHFSSIVLAAVAATKFRFESAFYLSIFRFPLTGNGVARALFMEFLITEMQIANAAGFFVQMVKSRA